MSLKDLYLSPFQTQQWLARLHESSSHTGIPLASRIEWAMIDISNTSIPFALTLAQLDRLLESGMALSNDPDYLKKVSMMLNGRQLDAFTPLLNTASTLRHACDLYAHYIPLIHPGLKGIVRDEPDGFTYIGFLPVSWPCTRHHWYDAYMVGAALSILATGAIDLSKCREIFIPESLKQLFREDCEKTGIAWNTQAIGGGIRISTKYLQTAIPGHLPGMDQNTSKLIELFSDTSRIEIRYSDLTVDALLRSVENGEIADLAAVAESLLLQSRTFQNHLRAEGTSFNELRSRVLIRLSHRYLAQGHSIDEVSSMLGYSTRNAFHSAFKRLTGYPPSLIRTFRVNRPTLVR